MLQSQRSTERIADQQHRLVHQHVQRGAHRLIKRVRCNAAGRRSAETVAGQIQRDQAPDVRSKARQHPTERRRARTNAVQHDRRRQSAFARRFIGMDFGQWGWHGATLKPPSIQDEASSAFDDGEEIGSRHDTLLLTCEELAFRVAASRKDYPAFEDVEAKHGPAGSAFGITTLGISRFARLIGVARIDRACAAEAPAATPCAGEATRPRACIPSRATCAGIGAAGSSVSARATGRPGAAAASIAAGTSIAPGTSGAATSSGAAGTSGATPR